MHPLQEAFPLTDLSDRDLYAIVRADWERNYKYSEHSPPALYDILQQWLRAGGITGYCLNVLLLGVVNSEGIFEFHSINGGGIRDLFRAMKAFLTALATVHETAVTFYDNPRVGELAKHIGYPFETARIDQGLDKTFSTTFFLRSH